MKFATLLADGTSFTDMGPYANKKSDMTRIVSQLEDKVKEINDSPHLLDALKDVESEGKRGENSCLQEIQKKLALMSERMELWKERVVSPLRM